MDLGRELAKLTHYLSQVLGLKTPRFWRRVLAFAALVVVGDWVVRLVLPLFLPFIVALAIAVVVEPLVRRAERVVPRKMAVVLVLGGTLLLVGLGLFTLGDALVHEIIHLAQQAPRLAAQARHVVRVPWVSHLLPNESSFLTTLATTAGHAVLAFMAQLPLTAFFGFFTILSTFLISFQLSRVQTALWTQFTEQRQAQLRRVWADIVQVLGGYLRAQVILWFSAFLVSLVWLVPYPTPYRLVLALVLSVLNFIPFFGPGLALGPWAWWLLTHNQAGLGVGAILLAVVLGLGRQLAEPRLLQQTFRVELLPLLIAIFAGEHLWGGAGILIGPLLLVLFESLQTAGMI